MRRSLAGRLVGGLVATVCGVVTGCTGSGAPATSPQLDAATPGPLTAQQAALLVDVPLERLAAALPGFQRAAGPTRVREGQACVYVSADYRTVGRPTPQQWDDVARAIEPQVRAWGMERAPGWAGPERYTGGGLAARNPHNDAALLVRGVAEPHAAPGAYDGLGVQVRVPLRPTEC